MYTIYIKIFHFEKDCEFNLPGFILQIKAKSS